MRPAFRILAVLMFALLMPASGPALGAEARAPVRIGVAGAFPTGYAGVLARYGLSHETLLDHQLADPDVVSRHDLIILAGLPGGFRGDVATAFRTLFDRGGSLLLDHSTPVGPVFAGRGGVFPRRRGAMQVWRAAGPFRLVGERNPLRADAGATETFPGARLEFVPAIADAEQAVVLAEYTGGPADAEGGPRGRWGVARNVAGQPAIALVPMGKGRILYCGPGIGQDIALFGRDYDQLILAMVRLLTDGRAVPQLVPEGPRLPNRQTPRALGLREAEPDGEAVTAAPPAPQWPRGPGAPQKPPAGVIVLEAEPAPELNVSGRIEGAGGEVLLNYWNSAHHVRVALGPWGVRVTAREGGRAQRWAAVRAKLPSGTRFVIRERRDRLTVIAGACGTTARLRGGVYRGAVGWRGSLREVRYHPWEPPTFRDDFMRDSDEPGGWETHGGTWETAPVRNPNLGANPFCYRVRAEGAAVAVGGQPFWDGYRAAVATRVDGGRGWVGIGLYVRDARNMFLFKAGVSDGVGSATREGGFSLVRLVEGTPRVLARRPGRLAPGQWYRLQIKAEGSWVGAFVDGVRVLAARDSTYTEGRIALYAEGVSARFDDVLVEPATTPAEPLQRLLQRTPSFAGTIDVDSWAGPATCWDADPGIPGLFYRRGTFFGDVRARFAVPDLPRGGQVALLLTPEGGASKPTVSLVLRREGTRSRLEIQRGSQVLSQAVIAAGPATLELRREGGRVLGLVNGRVLASAALPADPGGSRLGFRAVGFLPRISQVAVWSACVRDYTFDTAPVDWWVGSGEWDITNRWSCSPDWSWFGGASEDVAAIWHKQPILGNVVLDFFVGPKMMGPENAATERLSDFNAVLCGDGRNVESGYTFLVAPGGSGAKILRRGQVVAESGNFRLFARAHNRWANIRAEKLGGLVRLFVEGQLVLQYQDPDPLTGGHAGIFTRRNGIMVPRVTLYFQRLGPAALWPGAELARLASERVRVRA